MNTDELFKIMGTLIDSDEIVTFLKKYPSFNVERPDSGRQFAISEDLGVDLMFEPDNDMQGAQTKHLRKCQSAFLHSQGKDGHMQFKGEIPLGFQFQDSRENLLKKAKPVLTWKILEGEVPLNYPNPSYDRWEYENFTISAHYHKDGETMYFRLSRKNT